jgi:hypothetical protein
MIATLEIDSDNAPRRADVSAAANAVSLYETYVYVDCNLGERRFPTAR